MKIPEEWYARAAKNGIDRNLLRMRYRRSGWSLEQAADTPVMTRQEAVLYRNPSSRIISDELVQKAKQNGINRDVLRGRLRLGWSEEDAATKPLYWRPKKAKKAKKAKPPEKIKEPTGPILSRAEFRKESIRLIRQIEESTCPTEQQQLREQLWNLRRA